jgi:hypothetical protein
MPWRMPYSATGPGLPLGVTRLLWVPASITRDFAGISISTQ